MSFSSKLPKLMLLIPLRISESRLFFSGTVPPRMLLRGSKLSNKPLISSSDLNPIADFSMSWKILAKSSFKFLFCDAFLTTFSNN